MVLDELAAPGAEGSQVGGRRVEERPQFVVGEVDIAIEAVFGGQTKVVVIPVGVVENHVTEEGDSEIQMGALPRAGAGDPVGPATGADFPARDDAGIDEIAVLITEAAPDFVDRRDLSSGEAARGVFAGTKKGFRLEVAPPRFVENPVLHAVQSVALGIDGIPEKLNLFGRHEAVAVHGQTGPEVATRIVPGPVVRGVTGDDAVEILWVTLGFNQRRVAALGAAIEVGMGQSTGVEGAEKGAVSLRHDVDSTVGEIDNTAITTESPGTVVGGGGDVAGVGAAGGIAALQGGDHGAKTNVTGEATIADGHQLVVPVCRHPEFEVHFGGNAGSDAAEGGDIDLDGASSARNFELAGGDFFG